MQDNSTETGSPGPKPGNRIYRVPRIRPVKLIIPPIRPRRPVGVSLLSLIYAFVGIILLGTILLMLPHSSRTGEWTPFVDSLFTATSAVTTTGLIVVDTLDHWASLGQAIILVLIQLGGFGFMATATIFLIAAGRRIGLRGRILIGETMGVSQIGGVVRLTRNMLFFTIAAEVIGAIILYSHFSEEYGWQLGVWKSAFQSISAFNNAGFDIFGGLRSLNGYQANYLVLLTTTALIFLGSISFIVLRNLFNSRGLHRTTIDTKLVLLVTLILIALGTLVLLITESNNPQTLGNLPIPFKVLNSFVEAISSRTAGFSTINTESMALFSLLFTMVLMLIGGAAGSTAGGIKVNTVGLLLATIWNTIKGGEHPGAFRREFLLPQIFRALTLVVLALVWIYLAFLILSVTENFPSIDVLFETVSAFGTAGESTGITSQLSTLGRMVIIVTMFVGRLGPLILMFTLSQAQKVTLYRYPKESVRIG